MSNYLKLFFTFAIAFLLMALHGRPAAALPSFTIDNLVANYYLDHDAQKVGILTIEEVYSVRFPSSGASFTGLVRDIPARYQGRDIKLKITGVTDAGGNNIRFTTAKVGDDLEVAIGDPSITVFGPQTYTLRYQTKGAINFLNNKDEFYPNFNGRGWGQVFGNVIGAVHMPNSLADAMTDKPNCLIDTGSCQIDVNKDSTSTVITAKTNNSLGAKQSLTAKLSFKAGTFAPNNSGGLLNRLNTAVLIFGIVTAVLIVLAALRTTITKLRSLSKRPR